MLRRLLRQIGWLLIDIWHGSAEEPLYIDLKRVNQELRHLARHHDADPAYRNRVKDRMRDGLKCPHRPLFDPKPAKAVPLSFPSLVVQNKERK